MQLQPAISVCCRVRREWEVTEERKLGRAWADEAQLAYMRLCRHDQPDIRAIHMRRICSYGYRKFLHDRGDHISQAGIERDVSSRYAAVLIN
jgi:hypothetical protein